MILRLAAAGVFLLGLVTACGHAGHSATGGAGGTDAGATGGTGGTHVGATGGTGGTNVGATGGAGGTDAGATGGAGGADAGADAQDGGGDVMGCPTYVPVAASGEQVFVSPTGNDGAAGTEAAPLQSLGAAAKRLPMGGTIVVGGGQYGPQKLAAAGTASQPLVILAAAGATPVFDGSSITTNYGAVIHLTSAAHVVFQGLEIANGTYSNVTGILADGAVTDLTIASCRIHDMSGTLARFAGTGITFANNELYNGALINQNNPPMYQHGGWPTCMGTAPDTTQPTSPWPTNVTIRGNHVHDCWGEGIGIWFGAGVTIEDNVVERAFNVGIYLDNASGVEIARNFVTMASGMALNGGTGHGILLGVEPYSFNPTVQSDHDITIENNVIAANGIGWWSSNGTSPNNTYANVRILQNTILSTGGAAIGFAKVNAGATAPTGCAVIDNVIAEPSKSYLGDAAAFTFSGNAWLNETPPSIAGSTDTHETLSVPAVNAATDAEPLAAQVGQGVPSGVTADFACQPRSAGTPTRGAFEK